MTRAKLPGQKMTHHSISTGLYDVSGHNLCHNNNPSTLWQIVLNIYINLIAIKQDTRWRHTVMKGHIQTIIPVNNVTVNKYCNSSNFGHKVGSANI